MVVLRYLLVILLFSTSVEAWDFGLNGRSSSGYCSDPASTTYVLDGSVDAYPVSRGGETFGFTATDVDNARDRDSGLDCRLAGVVFQRNDGNFSTIRIDLPAPGTYDIRLAIGESSNARPDQQVEILDNATSKFTITSSTLAADTWIDANGNVRTSASDWTSNNTARSVTFASSILIIKLGTTANLGGGESRSVLAHIRVTSAGSSVPPCMLAGVCR